MSVTVTGTNAGNRQRTSGRLHLIDLAGSERLSKSEAVGARLKEAQAINKVRLIIGVVQVHPTLCYHI